MTLDEALSEACAGARVRCDVMPKGCYVEHLFSHGFVRCWPVDRVEDEPIRTQCGFRAHGDELTADWHQVERQPVPLPAPAPPPADLIARALKIAQASTWGKLGSPVEPKVEPKAVMVMKDGGWTKESLTAPEPALNKWGQPQPKGKWG